jgi:hypothetical protein
MKRWQNSPRDPAVAGGPANRVISLDVLQAACPHAPFSEIFNSAKRALKNQTVLRVLPVAEMRGIRQKPPG